MAGLLAAALSCVYPHRATAQAAPAEVTQLEYDVLSTYIARTFTGKNTEERLDKSVSNVVIVDRVQSDRDDTSLEDDDGKPIAWKEIAKYLHKKVPQLEDATLKSFREACTQPATFHSDFRLPVPYQLVHKAEIDAILDQQGWWTDYHTKYPGSQGFIELSRVGFAPDGRQAIFYAANHCGGKCGTGAYVVMEKADSGWRIAKEVLMWIS